MDILYILKTKNARKKRQILFIKHMLYICKECMYPHIRKDVNYVSRGLLSDDDIMRETSMGFGASNYYFSAIVLRAQKFYTF